MSEDDILVLMQKQSEEVVKLKRPKAIVYPRRKSSVVVPPRPIVYITPDKTTCAECTCFPKEDPYAKPKRLLACQKSPRLLYELAADVVDKLPFPAAFEWTEEDVAHWMANDVGLPEYRDSILDNHIDGMRLLMLEDPSKLPPINIHYFNHIQMITAKVRQVYSVDFIRFLRSIGLPSRRPLGHTTWFKSRTGPTWGIRKNWTRCGILRWMKIIMPEPVHLDHWDLVWYQKPDFPSVKTARVPDRPHKSDVPDKLKSDYQSTIITVPRQFVITTDIPKEQQFIWLDPTVYSPCTVSEDGDQRAKKRTMKFLIKEDSRLLPQKVTMEGLTGRALMLARRKKPKSKYLVMKYEKPSKSHHMKP